MLLPIRVKLRADVPAQGHDGGNAASEPGVRGRLQRRSLDTMTGKVVAQRYRIGRTLGVGGMGFVYEAVDLQTGIVVALKALPPGAPDPTRVKRLRREAAAGVAVRSEHVCRVDYLGVDSGTPFIVMERLHGHTLRTHIDQNGPFELQDAIVVMLQLLDALVATHAVGVIHRDVKPSNVFLAANPDGTVKVKLIDFGLAKLMGHHELNQRDSGVNEITTTESMIGTLQYLAPEHLLGVGELDERSDIYAAGLTLFEMLSGQRAFKGSYAEIVHEIILGDLPRARAFRPELPSVIDDILAHAVAKTRDRRFSSAPAFKRALQAALPHGTTTESGVCRSLEGEDDPGEPARAARDTDLSELMGADVPTVRPPPPDLIAEELASDELESDEFDELGLQLDSAPVITPHRGAVREALTGFEDEPTMRYRPDQQFPGVGSPYRPPGGRRG